MNCSHRITTKPHVNEETHYTPKSGPCSTRCSCGLTIEARYPKELEDMFREHRREALRGRPE